MFASSIPEIIELVGSGSKYGGELKREHGKRYPLHFSISNTLLCKHILYSLWNKFKRKINTHSTKACKQTNKQSKRMQREYTNRIVGTMGKHPAHTYLYTALARKNTNKIDEATVLSVEILSRSRAHSPRFVPCF